MISKMDLPLEGCAVAIRAPGGEWVEIGTVGCIELEHEFLGDPDLWADWGPFRARREYRSDIDVVMGEYHAQKLIDLVNAENHRLYGQ